MSIAQMIRAALLAMAVVASLNGLALGEIKKNPPDVTVCTNLRAVHLLQKNCLFDLPIREYANAEVRATTSCALLALSRRRLRTRDRLLMAIENHSDSFRRARPTINLSARLALSIISMAGIFLGILFSETLMNLSGVADSTGSQLLPRFVVLSLAGIVVLIYLLFDRGKIYRVPDRIYEEANPSKKGWLTRVLESRGGFWFGSISLAVFVGLFFYDGSITLVEKASFSIGMFLSLSFMVFLGYWMANVATPWLATTKSDESRDAARLMSAGAIVVGFVSFLIGSALPQVLAELVSKMSSDGSDDDTTEFDPNFLSHDEAGLFGFILLIVALMVFWGTANFQRAAENRHQQATRENYLVDKEIDGLGRDDQESIARTRMRNVLNLAPVVVLILGYVLIQFEVFPPEGNKVTTASSTGAIYTKVISSIGWALPVLSLSILAQVWNRFSESGALTLIHDVTLARLGQAEALIKSDEELIDRINAKYSKVPDPDKTIADTIRNVVTHFPNMGREAEELKLKLKTDSITAMKETVHGDFLRRSALVAASVIVILQIPPLRQLQPNTDSKDAFKKTLLAFATCDAIDVEPSPLCALIGQVGGDGGSVVVNLNGTPLSVPRRISPNGISLDIDISPRVSDRPATLGTIEFVHDEIVVPPAQVELSYVDEKGKEAVSKASTAIVVEVPAPRVVLEAENIRPEPWGQDEDGKTTLHLAQPKLPATVVNILGVSDESALVKGDVDIHVKPSDVLLDIAPPPVFLVDRDGYEIIKEESERQVAALKLPEMSIPEPVVSDVNVKLQLSPDLVSLRPEDKLKPKSVARNEGGFYDIGLGLELKSPEKDGRGVTVQNFYIGGDKVISRSDKNGMLLPLFPGPVKAQNVSQAFDEGRQGLLSLVGSAAEAGESYIDLLSYLTEPIEQCLMDGANLTVDVYGFASYRWDNARDSENKDNLNHALSEGRRMAVIDRLAQLKTGNGGILKVVTLSDQQEIETLVNAVNSASNPWKGYQVFKMFNDFDDMIRERDNWMGKVASGRPQSNKLEELFGHSALFKVTSSDQSGTCAFQDG